MKKLLYAGITLLLALAFYFNWGKSCQKDKPVDDKDGTPVKIATKDKPIPNEYAILMPKDKASKKYLQFKKYLDKHFVKVEGRQSCPCDDDLQLWTGSVDFEPDTDPPTGGSDTSYVPSFFLSRNYPISIDESIVFKYDFKTGSQKGPLVKIAILDTGVDTSISSLSAYLHRNPALSFLCDSRIPEGVYGMNMLFLTGEQTTVEPIDEDGHGTFINGIIGGLAVYPPAYNKNEQALNVSLDMLNVKIGKNRTTGSTLFKALCGMQYAVNKQADVINASWRVSPQNVDMNAVATAFLPVLAKMKKSKIMLVTSAGNSGTEDITHLPSSFSRPFTIRNGTTNLVADYSDFVVSVGAWNTANDRMAAFSNRGTNVDIYAPGQSVRSLALSGGRTAGSGTSYAAPFVTQRIAELIGANPSRTNLKTSLITTHSRTISPNVQVLIMR